MPVKIFFLKMFTKWIVDLGDVILELDLIHFWSSYDLSFLQKQKTELINLESLFVNKIKKCHDNY